MLTSCPHLVVPVGFDGVSSDDTANRDRWSQGQGLPNHLPEGGNDAWFHPELQQNFYVDGESGGANEDSNADVSGNGLYWFWDPAWGERLT